MDFIVSHTLLWIVLWFLLSSVDVYHASFPRVVSRLEDLSFPLSLKGILVRACRVASWLAEGLACGSIAVHVVRRFGV